MSERILRTIERFIPRRIYRLLQPIYHFFLAWAGAILYRFPAKHLTVIFITGTKGKTSTAEIMNGILEANGAVTALLGTLRFKVADKNERNMRKMTIPGRFFIQKKLREAVDAGCTHAVIEMTSEGAKQFRQHGIDADVLIFTNLAPEHIESHGSYEAYRDAKLSIARSLARSSKPKRFMVANTDDQEGHLFLQMPGVTPLSYGRKDGEPIEADDTHISLTFRGTPITSSLSGIFNAYNILGAATAAEALGIPLEAIAQGIRATTTIAGRAEKVNAGQSFPVVVDYAHTPDSLEALYGAFAPYHKICVLGNTGGGRDKWKRPVMGSIAESHCDTIILTNEDPYDEDPRSILEEIASGMHTKKPEIILDRKEAIERAVSIARSTEHAAVLITGKGTDPYIMGPKGSRIPWDDATVARAALEGSTKET